MLSDAAIAAASFLQGSIPLISLTAYLPQWRKIVATRSSKDISLRSWLLWSISASIAVFYAVAQYQMTGQGTALVFSSAVNLVFVLITVYLLVVYRSTPRRTRRCRISG
jgi:uncharacterized protein with PQ loop repeat